MVMIKNSYEDWNNNPIITKIERTDGTFAEDDVYPSITICKGSTFQPDPWTLPELIFNFFEFHCKNEKQCNKMAKIQNDFKSLIIQAYKTLSKSVDKFYKSLKTEKEKCSESYASQILQLTTMIDNNFTTLDTLNRILEKNIQSISNDSVYNSSKSHELEFT